MPDDKIEILDDIITEMDIETITLDDVELGDINETGAIIPHRRPPARRIK